MYLIEQPLFATRAGARPKVLGPSCSSRAKVELKPCKFDQLLWAWSSFPASDTLSFELEPEPSSPSLRVRAFKPKPRLVPPLYATLRCQWCNNDDDAANEKSFPDDQKNLGSIFSRVCCFNSIRFVRMTPFFIWAWFDLTSSAWHPYVSTITALISTDAHLQWLILPVYPSSLLLRANFRILIQACLREQAFNHLLNVV